MHSQISERRFDLSRDTFDATKLYRSIVKQQGRVTVDADDNEQRRIELHRSDLTTLDVIGQFGYPQGETGFQITPDASSPHLLDLGIGRMYVHGLMAENFNTSPEILLDTSGAPVVLSPTGGLYETSTGAQPLVTDTYLAYLDVWERDITALDDPNIRETALGGPDTAARTELVAEVHLLGGQGGATCATATLPPLPEHQGTLTAQTNPSAAAQDCTLPPLAGFRGQENQLYRVEIHQGGPLGTATFKWSRENGSVVTGITGPASGPVGLSFTVQNVGADSTLGFAANQWVELVDDDLVFTGQPGFLALTESVDAATLTITLTPTSPSGVISYGNNPKIRRWEQTDPSATNGVVTSATAIDLENGVQISFGGSTFYRGDYWMIPARTAIDEETGTLDFPATPQFPSYTRHHLCSLAVISYDTGSGWGTPSDCRIPFPPLTGLPNMRGPCCTVTVGDDQTAGDFTTVQAAVDALPSGGGEVCIRPGTYAGFVTIANKQNVVIHGCGGRTILTPGDTSATAVITIQASTGVSICDLAIVATTGPGIAWNDPSLVSAISNIKLERLAIEARDMSAIFGRNAVDVVVEDCSITLDTLLQAISNGFSSGVMPAIFLLGDNMRVEQNVVVYQIGESGFASAPLGGMQIGGGSDRVFVCRNYISGGLGNGITLGSVTFTTSDQLATDYGNGVLSTGSLLGSYYGNGILIDPGGCFHIVGNGPPPTPAPGQPQPPQPFSDGNLTQIVIAENEINSMGGNGIASLMLYDALQVYIGIDELWIESNFVHDCVQVARSDSSGTAVIRARGGIVLADGDLTFVRTNTILSNGSSLSEPTCGIYLQHGSELEIIDNHVEHNGALDQTFSNQVVPGLTGETILTDQAIGGGIVVELAIVSAARFTGAIYVKNPGLHYAVGKVAAVNSQYQRVFDYEQVSCGMAARIAQNVVSAPNGRALELVARGTVSVDCNYFAAFSDASVDIIGLIGGGQPTRPLDYLGGATVAVLNLGISQEFFASLISYELYATLKTLDSSVLSGEIQGGRFGGGDILFSNNQVELSLTRERLAIALSSVLLISADDVQMLGNQCNVLELPGSFEIVLVDGLLLSLSSRMSGNRMKEGNVSLLSGLNIGLIMNTTTGNQGTNCFLGLGLSTILDSNQSLFEVMGAVTCQTRLQSVRGQMTKFKGQP